MDPTESAASCPHSPPHPVSTQFKAEFNQSAKRSGFLDPSIQSRFYFPIENHKSRNIQSLQTRCGVTKWFLFGHGSNFLKRDRVSSHVTFIKKKNSIATYIYFQSDLSLLLCFWESRAKTGFIVEGCFFPVRIEMSFYIIFRSFTSISLQFKQCISNKQKII